MIPEQYKYETDYRKIPSEYLNKNIPQGRGMIKWRAFATISEQYEKLDEYMESQNKIDMPILSEKQIENINDKMVSYYHNKKLATINYWNNGYIAELVGYILNINTIDQYISVKNNLNITCTISFSKLYNIN
ncbi:YolD-like family protein [Staphylococcus aureus]